MRIAKHDIGEEVMCRPVDGTPLLPLEFTEPGDEGLAHVSSRGMAVTFMKPMGGRSHGESGAPETLGRVQAEGSAGDRRLHEARGDRGVASTGGSIRLALDFAGR